jgi:hypothetical protein
VLLHARERLLDTVVQELEMRVGEHRVHVMGNEIRALALSLLCGDIDFVKLIQALGGRKSNDKQGLNLQYTAAGAGRAGETTGPHAPQDIPTGLIAAGGILEELYVTTMLGVPGSQPGFGLAELAIDGLETLDVPRVTTMINEIFARLRRFFQRRRQRLGVGPPDVGAIVDAVRVEYLAPLTAEQASANIARSVAMTVLSALQTGGGTNAATAASIAAALAAGDPNAANVAGTPAGTTAGTPAVTPAGTPPKRKTGSERKKIKAAKLAAAAAGGSPAAGGQQSQQHKAAAAAAAAAAATAAAAPAAAAAAAPQLQTLGQAQFVPAPVPTFATNSIVRMVDIKGKAGAVEAFDYLCRLAHPGVPRDQMPCAFAELSRCDRANATPPACPKCQTRAALPAGGAIPPPPGTGLKVKAACDATTAAKITRV